MFDDLCRDLQDIGDLSGQHPNLTGIGQNGSAPAARGRIVVDDLVGCVGAAQGETLPAGLFPGLTTGLGLLAACG